MNFPSIDIQGSIISAELLGKIRSEQASFQLGKDFAPGLSNAKLKEEISLAWQDARAQWQIFKNKLLRLKEGETAATETRSFWILPLLSNLGYDFQYFKQSEEINGKSFWINNRDNNLAGFPLFIAGYNESLDKRPVSRSIKVSPHALVQEYLNYAEHLYGLVTNGRQLRLLRDASRLTRLSYLEFNLEKMMEEEQYADFVILYRLLHVSRMPSNKESDSESIIEKYHQEGLATGSAIREKLGDAVKGAILELANGFLNHPQNRQLRELAAEGKLDYEEYYRHLLRVIYRMLFLFVIEERNLVYGESKTPQTKRFAQIYFNHYSLMRLRQLSRKLVDRNGDRHYDLWQGLLSTFLLFENKSVGEKIGIMSLQGDLFGHQAISNNSYDLHQCHLSNSVLLRIIKSLCFFQNDNGVFIAVNYGGLDVEEFGSVYEGLLDLRLIAKQDPGTESYQVEFNKSTERGTSGSHYTPEELVQPLIKHSLEYLIEDRIKPYHEKKVTKEGTLKSLLELKIADVACGSGHILLSAARRLSLEVARVQTEEEQPNPVAIRKAMKDVVRNCIYGVDKNPLAVELCKIALWLEAYNPGEPLNFLDHHIKCGDAIVGLAHRSELENGIADEAFKTLPGDDKEIAAAFRKRNQQERKQKNQATLNFETSINEEINAVIEKYNLFKNLPETSPDEVAKKEGEYRNFEKSVERIRLKQLADAQVAQFFIPKTDATKAYLLTDNEYRNFLRNVNRGMGPLQSQKLAYVETLVTQHRFFHWFIEFPEVLNEGGFNCILGNPPFLGNRKLSGTFGDSYLEAIKYQFSPIGAVDLVTYFFRRIFTIIKSCGFQSLISTNTIAQGNAREGGLEIIIQDGGSINHAIKSLKWPGTATVEVSLVTITKQNWILPYFLDGKKVSKITTYLDDADSSISPVSLISNSGKCFQGSIVLGKGFVLNIDDAKKILNKNEKNKAVLFPFINGDDLNNSPDQSPGRWVINFFDWDENTAKQYPDCFDIVEKLVKPERQRWALDKNGNEIIGEYALRKPLPEKWWIYSDKRPALYNAIKSLQRVQVIVRISKYLSTTFIPKDSVYNDKCIVLADDSVFLYTIIQGSFFNEWSWKYGTTLGTGTLVFTPGTTFETFPFLKNINKFKIESIGSAYYEHRKQLMLGMQLGLTKTYNLFHSNAITAQAVNEKDRQVAALLKHLEKTLNTISFNEAIQGILKLRELHVQMDEALLEAYDWSDIQLRHDFYEVDYLPENDRIRFTIHPEARKEILKRLLALNHKIYEEELREGKHSLKAAEEFFQKRGESVPAEVVAKYVKDKKEKNTKSKKAKKALEKEESGQSQLFGEGDLPS